MLAEVLWGHTVINKRPESKTTEDSSVARLLRNDTEKTGHFDRREKS